jgi:MFS family permease
MLGVWTVQLLAISSSNLMLVLPRILSKQSITVSWQGWIMATFNIAFLAGSLFGGRAVQRCGYRTPGLIGAISIVIGSLLYTAGSYGIAFYFAARGLHGFGIASVLLAWQNRVVVFAHADQRGRALGMTNLLGFFALAVSPLVAEWLQRFGHTNQVFFTAAIICLPILPLATRLPKGLADRPSVPHLAGIKLTQAQWAGLLIIFTHAATLSSTQLLLPLLSGQTEAWSLSAFYFVYGMLCVIIRLWIEPAMHAKTSALLMSGTACLAPIGAILLPHSTSATAYAGLGILFGLAHGLYFPATAQLLTEGIRIDRLIDRVSLISATGVCGLILGECSAGMLARMLGTSRTITCMGAVLVLTQLVVICLVLLGPGQKVAASDSGSS